MSRFTRREIAHEAAAGGQVRMTSRALLLGLLTVVLLGCPSGSGPQGPQGEQGPAGMMGPQGPAGAPGMNGAPGTPGATGPAGAQGAMGAQGLQGPAGMVLVLDGGVVTGPAGSSVVVTSIAAGGATCPTGGVRVTQLSDGGITNLCNGVDGPMGQQGPAGVVGPQGGSVTATTLSVLSAQCATGGVLVHLPDAGTIPVCNGATGAQGAMGAQGPVGLTGATGAVGPTGSLGPVGAQGPIGATGATGQTGPQGPSGPPGTVLFLDGGVVVAPGDTLEFAGFTTALYAGNLGGYPGANTKCSAEFPGSFLCTRPDYDQANTAVGPGSTGAWIDYPRSSDGTRGANSCYLGGAGVWTYSGVAVGSSGQSGSTMLPTGDYTSAICNLQKPLACCRAASRVVFRGFTVSTFSGNLGGYPGANAKCSAEYAGSFLCTRSDYDQANTAVGPPASGSWIDYPRSSDGTRAANSCYLGGAGVWTYSGPAVGSSGQSGSMMLPTGDYTSAICNLVKPLACCSKR